ERMLQEASKGADSGGKASRSSSQQGGLSEDQIEQIEEQFGLAKKLVPAYLQWLGVLPREASIAKGEFGAAGDGRIGGGIDPDTTAVVVLKGSGALVHVTRENGDVASAKFVDSGN